MKKKSWIREAIGLGELSGQLHFDVLNAESTFEFMKFLQCAGTTPQKLASAVQVYEEVIELLCF